MNDIDVISLLIHNEARNEANINCNNKNGDFPITVVCNKNKKEIIKYSIENYAEINIVIQL